MDLVPDEYRLLLGMLDENILSDLVELGLSKNPKSLSMHLQKYIEAKAQDYYRLRSKEVEPFEYDQHDDANDDGFAFDCDNSNETSVMAPDWGSDVYSDPRADNVDDDPPNLIVPTTATLEESKVSGRVCIIIPTSLSQVYQRAWMLKRFSPTLLPRRARHLRALRWRTT